VYHGLNPKKSTAMEWYLPEKQSYGTWILIDPNLINKDEKGVLSQYFLLKNTKKIPP
jgi:hypothetical protein